jgi:hypothetical protein
MKNCEAQTPLCSDQLVLRYSVNGSEKEGKTFLICGPCKVWLGRISKITLAKPQKKAKK